MAGMTKTTLLKTSTVSKRLKELRNEAMLENERHRKSKEEIERKRRKVQMRCPHEETHISYGQYEKCSELWSGEEPGVSSLAVRWFLDGDRFHGFI